jgi:hypothetical protein
MFSSSAGPSEEKGCICGWSDKGEGRERVVSSEHLLTITATHHISDEPGLEAKQKSIFFELAVMNVERVGVSQISVRIKIA